MLGLKKKLLQKLILFILIFVLALNRKKFFQKNRREEIITFLYEQKFIKNEIWFNEANFQKTIILYRAKLKGGLGYAETGASKIIAFLTPIISVILKAGLKGDEDYLKPTKRSLMESSLEFLCEIYYKTFKSIISYS